MTDNTTHKSALVTGATSGLGFEAAAQLAEAGYDRVTITGRNTARAEQARVALVARTGRDVFETLEVDLNQSASVSTAAKELAERGHQVNFLLLNAGMVSGGDLVRTDEGVEITTASSLVGHHQLTMQLLSDDLLADRASIVIAGSEAARGDVMGFTPVDLSEFAAENYDGDLEVAAEALMRFDVPLKFSSATAYSTAKLFVAYWAAELARRLPDGMTVNAVSPGSAPDTDAGRNANFAMKLMMTVFKVVPGMSAPVSVAASRYVEVSEYPDDVSGEFFASAPKKMVGDLHRMDHVHVTDKERQQATWNALVVVSGGVDYPVAA